MDGDGFLNDDFSGPTATYQSNTSLSESRNKNSIPNESTHDVYALLNYYRTRCAEFDSERKEYLDRFASIESSHETVHRLKWDLKMKNEEISELQNTLSQTNSSLFDLKEKILKLQAENDALTIQEMEDRKRIQHLLALTQPVTEEVTFFRDCRPGRMTRFPVTADSKEPTTAPHINTTDSVNLEAELPSKYALSGGKLSGKKASTRKKIPTKSSSSSNNNQNSSSRVLRTVYLPSEQADTLMRTVQMLKTQMAEQQKLNQERLEAVMSSKASSSSAAVVPNDVENEANLANRVAELESKLNKSQDSLRNTTKDYLVTRHNAQEAERLAHEELSELRAQVKVLSEERQEFRKRAQVETRAIREAIQEEGQACAEEFRQEALTREKDMKILKEQYAAVQKTFSTRVSELQTRLVTLKKRYKDLDRRRRLEVEGFANDTMSLKRQFYKLESLYYGKHFDSSSKKNKFANTSEGLANEISTLQNRFNQLSSDIGSYYENNNSTTSIA